VNAKLAFGIVVMLVALIFSGLAFVLAVGNNADRLQDLCAFVDAEHNKTRADIVRGERELYAVYAKNFSSFIDTPEKRRQIHKANERNYMEVRETRPGYCADVRENPVKPYPPLSELR
jgi:hypothetical protein